MAWCPFLEVLLFVMQWLKDVYGPHTGKLNFAMHAENNLQDNMARIAYMACFGIVGVVHHLTNIGIRLCGQVPHTLM